MTGGFNALAVGSSNEAVSKAVCSESTCVMSCLVVLFLLNTLQNRKKRTGLFVQTAMSQKSTKELKKRESAASMCVIVVETLPLDWFSGFHDYSWEKQSKGFTAHTTQIYTNSILWGLSVLVHWSRWQWGLVLPCCKNFLGAVLPAQALLTQRSPAKHNPVRWSKNWILHRSR